MEHLNVTSIEIDKTPLYSCCSNGITGTSQLQLGYTVPLHIVPLT